MFRKGRRVFETALSSWRTTRSALKADTKVDTTIVEYGTTIVEYKVFFGAGKGLPVAFE